MSHPLPSVPSSPPAQPQANSSAKSFFRQSGWMMLASTLGGGFMFGVHFFAPVMGKGEYGLFGTLLQMLNLMMIPALGLQTVFAQQTAAASTEDHQRQLAATVRAILLGTALLWLTMAALAFTLRQDLISSLRIANPAALWITVAFGLPQLWLPVFQGVLQGRQDFAGMGWIGIMNGFTRLCAIAVIVLGLGGQAAGGMLGALIGQLVALGIAASRGWQVLTTRPSRFEIRGWLARVAPLTLGLGVGQFMLAADMIIVRTVFEPSQTGLYVWSGMIGRGLVMFTAPLVWVMFPKVVASAGKSEGQRVLMQALGGTAALAGLVGSSLSIACWAAPWVLRHVEQGSVPLPLGLGPKILANQPTILSVASLIPWFVWCMVPLSLAIVLINDLLARERYRAVPWLVVTAAAYGTSLTVFHHSFQQVIASLGVFSLILAALAAAFSRHSTQGTHAKA